MMEWRNAEDARARLRLSGIPPLHFSSKQGGRNEKQGTQEDGA